LVARPALEQEREPASAQELALEPQQDSVPELAGELELVQELVQEPAPEVEEYWPSPRGFHGLRLRRCHLLAGRLFHL
jgi:hypothetical protein